MEIEFTIGPHSYRASKLKLMAQYHVGRRVMPLVAKIIPIIESAQGMSIVESVRGKDGADAVKTDDARWIQDLLDRGLLDAVLDEMQGMKDADVEYVLNECLACVRRVQGGQLAPVWNRNAKQPMFDDLGLPETIVMVFQVIAGSLRNFSAALPSPSPGLRAQ